VIGLPPGPRGTVKVAVEFALGAEGILSVTARDLATGRVTETRLGTRDTPQRLREKLAMPELQAPPRGARPLEPGSAAMAGPGEASRAAPTGRLLGGS
jgi:molecular chaperone DnaK